MTTPRTKKTPQKTPPRLVEEIEWTDEDEAAADRAMARLTTPQLPQTPAVPPPPLPPARRRTRKPKAPPA